MQYAEQHITLEGLQPGLILDGFQVYEIIGEGNFGVVARVVSTSIGEEFAIKILKLWSVPEAARKNLVSRFRLEYETGRINSDFLVKTWHYGQWNGYPFFVMDYCPNGNLRQLITQAVPFETAQSLALNMLSGLYDLHKHGKTHRDLKPENILLDGQRQARLTDFGIAGHLNAQFTVLQSSGSPGEIFGSYNYMAPEQLRPLTRRDTLLPTIDLFAFGVICFELFTGRLPFGKWEVEEDMIPYLQRAQAGQWDRPTAYNPAISSQWEQVIEGCLAPDYRYRFQQVTEVLEVLGLPHNIHRSAHVFPMGLTILDGEEHGRTYDVSQVNEKIIRIGRAVPGSRNHLDIREEYSAFISRFQATLELHPDGWYLRDGQWQDGSWRPSKNGTFLNGITTGTEGQSVSPGDVITVGNTTIKVITL